MPQTFPEHALAQKQREKLLRHFGGYHEQLYKDALTGAYNRRYFEEKIRKSTVSAGVAMIDLDDFKTLSCKTERITHSNPDGL